MQPWEEPLHADTRFVRCAPTSRPSRLGSGMPSPKMEFGGQEILRAIDDDLGDGRALLLRIDARSAPPRSPHGQQPASQPSAPAHPPSAAQEAQSAALGAQALRPRWPTPGRLLPLCGQSLAGPPARGGPSTVDSGRFWSLKILPPHMAIPSVFST